MRIVRAAVACFAILAPGYAIAADVGVEQLGARNVSAIVDQVRADSAPPPPAMPVEEDQSDTAQTPSDDVAKTSALGVGDVSLISQTGSNNQAIVTQTGDDARSVIVQNGFGNLAVVRQ